MIPWKVKNFWFSFWMSRSGYGFWGRLATRFAAWFYPPYFARVSLSNYSRKGYISPAATIFHHEFHRGDNIFIDERVLIFQAPGGGPVRFGDRVRIFRDTIIQTGRGGEVVIDSFSAIQPRCIFSAYKGPINIGKGVQIAPNCSFYSYDHGIAAGELIGKQPLTTKGGIVVGDDAWLGVGVTVLDGVSIGKGTVIGAGSVVKKDIPDGAVACGVPARVVKMRSNIK